MCSWFKLKASVYSICPQRSQSKTTSHYSGPIGGLGYHLGTLDCSRIFGLVFRRYVAFLLHVSIFVPEISNPRVESNLSQWSSLRLPISVSGCNAHVM